MRLWIHKLAHRLDLHETYWDSVSRLFDGVELYKAVKACRWCGGIE